jgi:hypothetical protein
MLRTKGSANHKPPKTGDDKNKNPPNRGSDNFNNGSRYFI